MDRNYCFIFSAKRSGSTLLKALIGTRPDCSHLPETPFRNYESIVSDKRIVVLKDPAGYNKINYPEFEPIEAKKIVLIRNPYDTICSMKEMHKSVNETREIRNSDQFLISHWYLVYNNIIEKRILENDDAMLVRYEDLLDQPVSETEKIFKFIGTDFPQGTDTYLAPANYTWDWGNDDGAPIIKTLKVQKRHKEYIVNQPLLEFINSSPEIKSIMTYYGYSN